MSRTGTLVAAVVLPVAFVLQSSAAASPSQSVTLKVLRTVDQPTGSYRLSFSGTISSGAAGEDVTVMQQTCGVSFSTAVAGAQTREGGAWDGTPADPNLVAASATYRARWKDVLSEPVANRPPMPIFFFPVSRTQWRARVILGSVPQAMKGKLVVLQRLRSGKWTTVARKRLVRDAAGASGFAYATTFAVPRRWTVRAFVPARTAAPCFGPNATEKLRSS
jgi:hypothetical protein